MLRAGTVSSGDGDPDRCDPSAGRGEALKYAYRFGHDRISTGHLLLATLDSQDRTATHIIGSGPASERIARELLQRLPGHEHEFVQSDHGLIDFDVLTRSLRRGWRRFCHRDGP